MDIYYILTLLWRLNLLKYLLVFFHYLDANAVQPLESKPVIYRNNNHNSHHHIVSVYLLHFQRNNTDTKIRYPLHCVV